MLSGICLSPALGEVSSSMSEGLFSRNLPVLLLNTVSFKVNNTA